MQKKIDQLLDTKDIMKWFNVSENTVYNWRKKEGMPHLKLTSKTIKYEKDEVKKWAEEKGKM